MVQKRGACAYYRGDYADASGARDYAEALYRRALGVFDRDARTPPETTLTALRNLGDCLVENGKPSQAAPVLGRVVQLRERLGLPLLGCVEDHAAMLHDAGKHAAAEAPYRRALVLAQKAFGSESVDALPARENLAALLWDAGKAGEAEPEYRIVLERLEALVGGAHPDAAAACHDLGEVLVELGRGDEARPPLAGGAGATGRTSLPTTPTSSPSKRGSRATSRRSRRARGTAPRSTIAGPRSRWSGPPAFPGAGGAAASAPRRCWCRYPGAAPPWPGRHRAADHQRRARAPSFMPTFCRTARQPQMCNVPRRCPFSGLVCLLS